MGLVESAGSVELAEPAALAAQAEWVESAASVAPIVRHNCPAAAIPGSTIPRIAAARPIATVPQPIASAGPRAEIRFRIGRQAPASNSAGKAVCPATTAIGVVVSAAVAWAIAGEVRASVMAGQVVWAEEPIASAAEISRDRVEETGARSAAARAATTDRAHAATAHVDRPASAVEEEASVEAAAVVVADSVEAAEAVGVAGSPSRS